MARGFGGIGPVGSSPRFRGIALGGGLLAIVFMVLAVVLLSSKPTEQKVETVEKLVEAPIKMVDVLVPLSEVPMSVPLEPQMFRLESRPQVGIDSRTVRSYEEIKGHYSRSLIVAGQPLSRELITPIRPNNAVTGNIPDGYRAVTIRVDARTSVEGFVQPGATVDVNWITTQKGRPVLSVIVQNAKVLSAERMTQNDQAMKPGAPIPSTVTLLVSDRDAGKIHLASTSGTLSLSLRGDTDRGKGSSSDLLTADDLIKPDGENKERNEGTVTINGQKFILKPDGDLVPEN